MRIVLLSVALCSFALPARGQMPAPSPVIVFFTWDVSTLTTETKERLDSAVTAYRRSEQVEIMIAGQADRQPSGATYSIGVGQRRERTVRDYLVAAGVKPQDIVMAAFGRQQRPDHAHVYVTFGPGSGW